VSCRLVVPIVHTIMTVSNTRLYVPYDCVNGFRKSILAGYKTQTIRFWGGKTVEQFKNRVLDQHLVRLGGRSQSSCWGHARIDDVQVINIRDLTEDDISREGAPGWVTNWRTWVIWWCPDLQDKPDPGFICRVRFTYCHDGTTLSTL
jgi:hypothetical protein